jgi:hypothetical protein
MPITYHPPKRQRWGHRVGRLSPLQLHERSETFLRDKTIVVALHEPEVTVIWSPADSIFISQSIDSLPPGVGGADGEGEGDFFGKALRRITRKLSPASLQAAVEWLEATEPHLNNPGGLPPKTLLYRYVDFQWRDSSIAEDAPVPFPNSMLGVFYSRPRCVSTFFQFETIQQYYNVKTYLIDLELVTLSDKHVRPKGAISGGTS